MSLNAVMAFDFYRVGPFIYAVCWLATTLAASLVKDGATKKTRAAYWLLFSAMHWGAGLVALAMIWPR